MATTAVPVSEVIGDIQPGAYVITAKVTGSNQEYWREVATQWFIVTDLGITTVEGEDGLHVFVRRLGEATALESAYVRLIARNNEILGEGSTDADGRIVFAPGLTRGDGGRAPQLVVAETDGGDYAFLDVSKPAFDLTDRGVKAGHRQDRSTSSRRLSGASTGRTKRCSSPPCSETRARPP